MTAQAFNRIFGTTRMKATTSPEQRTYCILIDSDQARQGHRQPGACAHPVTPVSKASISARHCRRCWRRSSRIPSEIGLDKRITISTRGSEGRRARKDSRTRRLIRLRKTERRASRFGITRPRRAVAASLARNRSSNLAPRSRLELAARALNCEGWRNRAACG